MIGTISLVSRVVPPQVMEALEEVNAKNPEGAVLAALWVHRSLL
jgi:hypothetical protein